MTEEIKHWLEDQISMGPGSSKTVNAYETLLRIVAGVSSRVFVGQPRNRDEKWLETAVNYTLDVFRVSSELRPYPEFLRRFVAPRLDSTKRLQGHIDKAKECFGGIFAERLAGLQQPDDGIRHHKPNDMFQWMVDSTSTSIDRDPEVLIRKMLFLTLAAVHTSTMSVTHALLDLCAYTEYKEPLQEEISRVVKNQGWTLGAINELMLLDSFMKESQRINHPGLRE